MNKCGKEIEVNKLYSILMIISCLFWGCASQAVSVKNMNPQDKAFIEKVMAFPTSFYVSKEDAKEAWGRCQAWVARYSDLQLKIVSDYFVHTSEGLSGLNYYGYKVTRKPEKEHDFIEVQCIGEPLNTSKSVKERNAHLLAWYIKTGEIGNEKLINGGM